MHRLVYVAGFGNPQAGAEYVSHALGEHLNYDDAVGLSLAWALQHPDVVRRAVHKQTVFTHSAGMLALKGMRPTELHSFNPPIPQTRKSLFVRAVTKAWRERGQAVTYPAAVHKAAASVPVATRFRPLVNGEISRFNAIETAKQAHDNGIAVGLAYAQQDDFFRPSIVQLNEARSGGVLVAQIPGRHGVLVDTPEQAVDAYFANRY